MALDAVWGGGPETCHFAITSACNARCGFCSFARDKLRAASRHLATLAEAKLASDILKRNGIGFVHFTGGEPLVHPYISIDAASCAVHDSNRGLSGLSARIRRANAALKQHQIPSSASVR